MACSRLTKQAFCLAVKSPTVYSSKQQYSLSKWPEETEPLSNCNISCTWRLSCVWRCCFCGFALLFQDDWGYYLRWQSGMYGCYIHNRLLIHVCLTLRLLSCFCFPTSHVFIIVWGWLYQWWLSTTTYQQADRTIKIPVKRHLTVRLPRPKPQAHTIIPGEADWE